MTVLLSLCPAAILIRSMFMSHVSLRMESLAHKFFEELKQCRLKEWSFSSSLKYSLLNTYTGATEKLGFRCD